MGYINFGVAGTSHYIQPKVRASIKPDCCLYPMCTLPQDFRTLALLTWEPDNLLLWELSCALSNAEHHPWPSLPVTGAHPHPAVPSTRMTPNITSCPWCGGGRKQNPLQLSTALKVPFIVLALSWFLWPDRFLTHLMYLFSSPRGSEPLLLISQGKFQFT